MEEVAPGDGVATHQSPAWRDRANFIIAVDLEDVEEGARWVREQLWARKIADRLFEICCIPFFCFGISMGDIVETDEGFDVQRVTTAGGHTTFRIWVDEGLRPDGHELTAMQVAGATLESHSRRLHVLDAKDETVAAAVLSLCEGLHAQGRIEFEFWQSNS